MKQTRNSRGDEEFKSDLSMSVIDELEEEEPDTPSSQTSESLKESFRPDFTEKRSCVQLISALYTCFHKCRPDSDYSEHEYQREYRPPADNNYIHVFSLIERGIYGMSMWCYRARFLTLLLVFTLIYFSFVTFFALLLHFTSRYYYNHFDRTCISSTYVDQKYVEQFEYAFDLSWTTLSTVGYGVFSPDSEADCWLIRFICAIESFFGILFASCCGALLYAKINRIQYRAPVTFSRVICLQYGKGLVETSQRSSVAVLYGSPKFTSMLSPRPKFPFIEFRIVHDGCDGVGKGLIDAKISSFVILKSSLGLPLKSDYIVPNMRHSSASSIMEHPAGYKEKYYFPGRIFHQLTIDNEKLPYFDKVWYVRHTLDHNSPLLKKEVKDKIIKDRSWPTHLNDYNSIKESLIDFDFITVQLQGMNQVTASPVYAEMVYNYKSIYVGWQITGLLYCYKTKNSDTPKFFVDKSLVHDIAPQRGGGNEPICERIEKSNRVSNTIFD